MPARQPADRSGRLWGPGIVALCAGAAGVAGAYEQLGLVALAAMMAGVGLVVARLDRGEEPSSEPTPPPIGSLEVDSEIAQLADRAIADRDAMRVAVALEGDGLLDRLAPARRAALVEAHLELDPEAGRALMTHARPDVRWLALEAQASAFDGPTLIALAVDAERAVRGLALAEAIRRGAPLAAEVARLALNPPADHSAVPDEVRAARGRTGSVFIDPESVALDWLARSGGPAALPALRRARARPKHAARAAQRSIESGATCSATRRSSQLRVWVRVGLADGRLRVQIDDNGPGVAAEDRARVFDRHFSRRSGGSGLGLAIAHAIVLAHGGRITLLDRPEGGARAVVELRST